MKPSPNYDELDRLVANAQKMEPAPLSDLGARRMLRVALSEHQAEQALSLARWWTRPLRPWRLAWFAAATVLLVCGLFVARSAWPSGTVLTVDAADHPLRVALLAGDAVTVAPGAELELLSQTSQRRQIRVRRGSVLFDVVKLRPGEDFEVVTAHAIVHVVGTVFSVQVSEQRTLVRVYEGRVRTGHGVLTPGSAWSSNAGGAEGRDPLSTQALAAAQARSHEDAGRATVHALIPVQPLQISSPLDDPSVDRSAVSVPTAPRGSEVVDGGAAAQPVTLTPAQGRLLLAQGETEQALASARTALATRPAEEFPWRALEADSLRALGSFHEAIAAYEHAATLAAPAERAQLAYDAAALAFSGVHDPARVLALIDRWGLDVQESPLRERAGRLRVHALLALNRVEEAREAARRYLARERETAVSDEMRKLLGW